MAEIYLNDIAHGRSGDKGDTSNVCVYARKPEYYKIIEREVTPEKLKAYFGDMVKGEITRYDVPSLNGFNFVMKHALGGGATMSLRLDSLGKSMGSAVMRMKIHVEDTHPSFHRCALPAGSLLPGPDTKTTHHHKDR